MAVLFSPDCRDNNCHKCDGTGWDEEADAPAHCPCQCHPGRDLCGSLHEAPGLAYLGACVMGRRHEGPHQFTGPIDGTVISVTLGDGWTRTREEDRPEHMLEPGLKDVLKGLGRALAPRPGPDQ